MSKINFLVFFAPWTVHEFLLQLTGRALEHQTHLERARKEWRRQMLSFFSSLYAAPSRSPPARTARSMRVRLASACRSSRCRSAGASAH